MFLCVRMPGATINAVATLLLAGLCAVAWPCSPAYGLDCATAYKQKKYLTAASCFLRSARKMGRVSRLKASMRLKKGGLLRNAAVSFMKAAKKERRPSHQAYLQERAMRILRSYDRDRLCASPGRCAAARRQAQKLYRAIRYGRLSLVFARTPVAIQVTGFRYRTTKIIKRSPWRLRLRPGRYDIALIGLGQQKKIGTVRLAPSEQKRWAYTPPTQPRSQPTRVVPPRRVLPRRTPPRRPIARQPVARRPIARRPVARRPMPRRVVARREPPPRPKARDRVAPRARVVARRQTTPMPPPPRRGTPGAATALYIIGGVALAAGIGVTGYAIYAHGEGTAKYNDPSATLGEAKALQSAYGTALPISIALLAVGATSLAVGGILHAVQTPASPAPQAATPYAHTLWRSQP